MVQGAGSAPAVLMAVGVGKAQPFVGDNQQPSKSPLLGSRAVIAIPQMLFEHNLSRLYQTNPLFCYQQIMLFDVFSRATWNHTWKWSNKAYQILKTECKNACVW